MFVNIDITVGGQSVIGHDCDTVIEATPNEDQCAPRIKKRYLKNTHLSHFQIYRNMIMSL